MGELCLWDRRCQIKLDDSLLIFSINSNEFQQLLLGNEVNKNEE